jgi:hypothetical protein
MLARPRPPGFSPWICLRQASEEYSSKRLSRGRKPLRESTRANSGFRSVFFKTVCIRNESCNRKYPARLSTTQRSSLSTTSYQYAQDAVAADDGQLDGSVIEDPGAALPADLEKLTVVALKDLLVRRSLKTSGRKSELIARLREAESVQAHAVDTTNQKTSQQVNIERDSKMQDSLPAMTVKELRERLRELGLPSSGLKSQLIERLATHEREKQLSDIQHMQVDRASIVEKPASISEDYPSSEYINHISLLLPKVEEGRTGDLSKSSSTLKSPTSMDTPLTSSIQSLSNPEMSLASVSLELNDELKSPMGKPERRSGGDSSMRLLQEGLAVSEVHSRVLVTQLAISSLLSAVSSLPTTSMVEINFEEVENSSNRDFAIERMHQELIVAEVYSRLLASKMAILRLSFILRLLPMSTFASIVTVTPIHDPSTWPASESPELQSPDVPPMSQEEIQQRITYHPGGPVSEDGLTNYERLMSVGEMFFSKALYQGIDFNSGTKRSLRLSELPRESILLLRNMFFKHLRYKTRRTKILWSTNYLNAWKMALHEFARRPRTSYIHAPTNVSVQEKEREPQLVALKEVEHEADRSAEASTTIPTMGRDETIAQDNRRVRSRLVPGDSDLTNPVTPSYGTDSPANSPLTAAKNKKPQIKILGGMSAQNAHASLSNIIQSRSGRPLLKNDIRNYPAWRARFVEHLSGTPVTIELTIDNLQKKRFLMRDPSDHSPGPFLTTGDPYCQIFNSMWLRLGLLDHINSIRPSKTDLQYSVTFKSFEAAAAFVNRPNEHWLDDQITGQIYATWPPEGPRQLTPMVTLIFPRATIDVWRRAALEHDVDVSKYGLPYVDWGRSFQSVLMRMKMDLGRDGECLWYKIVSEYAHRMVMAVCFRDFETLEQFVSRKEDHCLSSIWKDRFFVKERGVKYESLPSKLILDIVLSGCLSPRRITLFLRWSKHLTRRSRNWSEIINYIILWEGASLRGLRVYRSLIPGQNSFMENLKNKSLSIHILITSSHHCPNSRHQTKSYPAMRQQQ